MVAKDEGAAIRKHLVQLGKEALLRVCQRGVSGQEGAGEEDGGIVQREEGSALRTFTCARQRSAEDLFILSMFTRAALEEGGGGEAEGNLPAARTVV